MKAVVLAAGEGTRLRPRTEDVPKPLIEVAGEPILSHVFDALLDAGITDAVVVVGYRKTRIIDRYGESYGGLDLEYAHQEDRDGLAHAVLAAEDYVHEDFAVVNGDNVYAGNLSAALDRHAETDADVTLLTEHVNREEAKDGAVCELNEEGNVTALVEKPENPPSTLAPAAFYVLPPEAFAACRIVRPSARGEYELPDAIDILLYSGYRVETASFEGWRVNVNTQADVERAQRRLSAER